MLETLAAVALIIAALVPWLNVLVGAVFGWLHGGALMALILAFVACAYTGLVMRIR